MAPRSLIPWTKVRSWLCLACGECCKKFRVPLRAKEYAEIVSKFGYGAVTLDVGRAYLRGDPSTGRCVFQRKVGGRWVCGIQEMKPLACKLWPFAVLDKPRGGGGREALYPRLGRKFYVYVDARCPGVELGAPSERFVAKVLPEVVKLSQGAEISQLYSTSPIPTLELQALTAEPKTTARETLIRPKNFIDYWAGSSAWLSPGGAEERTADKRSALEP